MLTDKYSGQGKCVICDRENIPYEGPRYAARCIDRESCFDNRVTTRIIDQRTLKLEPKYIEDTDEQFAACCRTFSSQYQIQMADFVVLFRRDGGIEFLKDRYEDTKGKIFFAP